MFSVQASFFSLTVYLQFTVESDNQFLLQSAGCTLATKRKSQKNSRLSKALKWDNTLFGPEKLLFWPWCSCPGPAREPRFLPLWEQIDKCGDCAEPYRESCCVVHGASYSAARIEARRKEPQKHSWLHTNRSGTKRGRGVNWYDVTNPSSQQAALLNSAQHVAASTNKQMKSGVQLTSSKTFHRCCLR